MLKHSITMVMLVTFFLMSLGPLPDVNAQTIINLPAPGLMVTRSIVFKPTQLKGIQVRPDNPLRFEFLVDRGQSALSGQDFKEEVTRLTKYFLTSLTVPESDLWVNLSPYEKDRIAPNHLGMTQMGKDLLEQDYLLKQVVASISYPEQKLGANFWKRVHERAFELYGTTEIPMSTFNKVWIIPKTAEVYVRGDSAFVVKSELDVMLEADYLALSKNNSTATIAQYSKAYSDIFKEMILPELRKEVNSGKNFALLRQMYDAMILATWYKRHLQDSMLGKKYIGQNKVNGVNVDDKNIKERIFQQYLTSFKKRVYSYIKEDYDPFTQKSIPRKYVSGGMNFSMFGKGLRPIYHEMKNAEGMVLSQDLAMATVDLSLVKNNKPIKSVIYGKQLMRGFGFESIQQMFERRDQASVTQTQRVQWQQQDESKILKADLSLLQKKSKQFDGAISEQGTLQEDLKTMQQLSSRKDYSPGKNPEQSVSQAVKNSFRILDIVSLVAGVVISGSTVGFDQWQSYALALLFPFVTRASMGLHIGMHEYSHMLAASPWGWRDVMNGRNLRANVDAKIWGKLFMPMTSLDESFKPHIRLPKQVAQGWQNTFVHYAGVVTTLGIGVGVGSVLGVLAASGNQISEFLLFPWTIASTVVGAASVWSDIILRNRDSCTQAHCGIIGMILKIPESGIALKKAESWMQWLIKATDSLTDRGGQQAGISTLLSDSQGNTKLYIEKKLKNKRGLSFVEGMPVFYRNMITDVYGRFYRKLPKVFVPVQNFGRATVLSILSHVRFATGGELVTNAAHPHAGPIERKSIWVFDNNAVLSKKEMNVVVTVGHNGDNDGAKLGIPLRSQLLNSTLNVAQMRKIFPALVHSYYQGKITKRYLKKNVDNGKENNFEQVKAIQYDVILKSLMVYKYISIDGKVSPTFKGLSDEFKNELEGYSAKTFNEIESALYGLPPGDSPIIPLQLHLYLTQGNWDASVRYAHVMVNHHNVQDLMEDVLTQEQEVAVGGLFNNVFESVKLHLQRRGYKPEGDYIKSLKDLWVNDLNQESQGLADQQKIVDLFKDLLVKAVQEEMTKETIAGNIFKKWSRKWQLHQLEEDRMLRQYVDTAVKKFFTADREAAVKEFAERAEGTYGLFVRTSVLDDGVTLYSDNQDVAVLRDSEAGVIAFASDPRVLKFKNVDSIMPEVMHLKDEEIVNLTFAPSGKILTTSSLKSKQGWQHMEVKDINKRFYPISKVIYGHDNPYYAPPPKEYKKTRNIVKDDLENLSRIVATAEETWGSPETFNRQTSYYLSERLKGIYEKNGRVRLVIIGYDNSETLSRNFKELMANMVPQLHIDVIDANEFDDNPAAFNITEDTVSLIVSKSGATFPTKLAANILKSVISIENIFGMTARMDSVLNTVLEQGLRPEDPFSKRLFITGEFYPSEAPVASEVLLLYQLTQAAFHIAKDLRRLTWSQNVFKMLFDQKALDLIHTRFELNARETVEQFTGFDRHGQVHQDAWGEKLRNKVGKYLGNVFLESNVINRVMDLVVLSVFMFGGPLTFLMGGIKELDVLSRVADFFLIRYIAPWGLTELYRKIIGRPAHARLGAPKIFIVGDSVVNLTQRNFFSRLFANSLSSTGPSALYRGDAAKGLVTELSPDVARGDIMLNVVLKSKIMKGSMSIKQATFPKTGAFFGMRWFTSRGQPIYVPIDVPHRENATVEEKNIIDASVGTFALMVATKTIGVTAVMRASLGGVLWNPAHTFSRAGVHTTPTPVAVNEKAKEMIEAGKRKKVVNFAMTSRVSRKNHLKILDRTKGGIDFNSQWMTLGVQKMSQEKLEIKDHAWETVNIEGLTPQVAQIIPVTPLMLQSLLGQPNLN